MAELLSYRFHEEIDFIMEGPVGRLHSMADEVAALEQQHASLQQRVEALEQARQDALHFIAYNNWEGAYDILTEVPAHLREQGGGQ